MTRRPAACLALALTLTAGCAEVPDDEWIATDEAELGRGGPRPTISLLGSWTRTACEGGTRTCSAPGTAPEFIITFHPAGTFSIPTHAGHDRLGTYTFVRTSQPGRYRLTETFYIGRMTYAYDVTFSSGGQRVTMVTASGEIQRLRRP